MPYPTSTTPKALGTGRGPSAPPPTGPRPEATTAQAAERDEFARICCEAATDLEVRASNFESELGRAAIAARALRRPSGRPYIGSSFRVGALAAAGLLANAARATHDRRVAQACSWLSLSFVALAIFGGIHRR